MREIRTNFLWIVPLILSLMLPYICLYGDGHISGKITDFASETPIKGINVILVGSFTQETTTDEMGIYQFLNVPSGLYKVQIEPPFDYKIVDKNSVDVEIVSMDEMVNFVLAIPGNIIGCVTDANTHLPIAHANIDIMRGKEIVASVLTNEMGMYNISGLLPKPHIVKVRMPYFQSSVKLGIPISNETITIDFSLQFPPGKIQGRVVNMSTGQPIHQATIEMMVNDLIIDTFQTNQDGSYVFLEVPPGDYQVMIKADQFETACQKISLLTNQILTTDFVLEPYGILMGQVVHAFTGQPISKACVGIWQNDVLLTVMYTDENGYYSTSGFGHHAVVVQTPRFYDLTQEIDIPSDQTVTLNFNMVCFIPRPPSKVSVKVMRTNVAHHINRIHRLKWKPSPTLSVNSYRIYRNGKFIAEVLAKDPLIFNDEWRIKKETTYQLTAVNHFGQESEPLSITVK